MVIASGPGCRPVRFAVKTDLYVSGQRIVFEMSSTRTKQYTPTTTARPTWREREAQKERQQREAARAAADEIERKKIAKTEENFPSMIQSTNKMTVYGGPQGKFLELANKLQVDEDAIRAAKKARRQRVDYNPALFIRSGRARSYEEDEDDYESTISEQPVDLNEMYPPHGKRGTYSEPDYEGWRTVLKKVRKQPRELTEAELVRKYRAEFFGEGEEVEDGDHNGDLTERNQRREFY